MLVSSGSALGAENTELPSIWWAAEKYSGWVENVNLNLYLFKTQTSWPVCVINTVVCVITTVVCNLSLLKIRSYCTYSTELLSHFCEWNTLTAESTIKCSKLFNNWTWEGGGYIKIGILILSTISEFSEGLRLVAPVVSQKSSLSINGTKLECMSY